MTTESMPPLRVSEAARELGISNQLTLKAIKRGEIDAFRLGRLWFVRRDCIDRLVHGESLAQTKDTGRAATSAAA
jgi:excisionase family DNA binding protein